MNTTDSMPKIRVLLAAYPSLVRAGLHALLDRWAGLEVVAETGDGAEALRLAEIHRPDVAIMECVLPGLAALEVTARLAGTDTRVLLLARAATPAELARALRFGAAAYLSADEAPAELERVIHAVARGETHVTPGVPAQTIAHHLRRLAQGTEPLAPLTARHREVLQLVAEGYTTKEIAVRLSLSAKTVENHRAAIMKRLAIHDTAGLVRLAIRAGLVSADS